MFDEKFIKMLGAKFIIYFVIASNCLWSFTVESSKVNVNVTDLVEEISGRAGAISVMDTNLIRDSAIFDMRVDTLPDICQHSVIPSSCSEATACTNRSGYYYIQMNGVNHNNSFLVECDVHTEGGVWTVVQRRQDGSVDFYRPWDNYKEGFGNIDDAFFIGLDTLHALTTMQGPQELLILMEYSKDNKAIQAAYAKYDSFAIGGASEAYRLNQIGKYSGTAGDSLQNHINCKFTTKDQDNDHSSSENCAQTYLGGWWYNNCHQSNLNGHYNDGNFGKGLNWFTFTGHNASLKYVKMMIRRRHY